MIGLARKMGYRCVAEGVETSEAADVLTQIGCEEAAKGFLFARPMDVGPVLPVDRRPPNN